MTTTEQPDDVSRQFAELHDRPAHAKRQITVLKGRVSTIEAERLTRAEINAAFRQFEDIWNALSPREQALSLLIDGVAFDAADNSIAITFHPSAIKSLAGGQSGDAV